MTDADLGPRSSEDSAAYDSLQLYLAEIGRYPLLTRAQEVQLAKRIESGDPIARQRMIESNLRLVVTIARGYSGHGLELLDLIQEGTLGLMKAVDKYDWRRETKFSTYAAWWIRHGITQALTNSARSIRLPESMLDRLASVRRTERALMARLGQRPSAAEIASELELTPAQVLEALAAGQPVGSLDEPAGQDGEARQAELVADPVTVDPLQSLVDEAREGELEACLRRLPERGRRVIELRFGLRDGVARTAEAVAAELGVTRERVRQIELNALRKLSAAANAPIAQAA
jgi:RNA polymerase primary sigma factor